jgi:hypothetical protein
MRGQGSYIPHGENLHLKTQSVWFPVIASYQKITGLIGIDWFVLESYQRLDVLESIGLRFRPPANCRNAMQRNAKVARLFARMHACGYVKNNEKPLLDV